MELIIKVFQTLFFSATKIFELYFLNF